MAGGKLAGYLQVWPGIWTRNDREQIQLAVRASFELGALRTASLALLDLKQLVHTVASTARPRR